MSHLGTILTFSAALILAVVGFVAAAVPAWFILSMFAAGFLVGVTFCLERGGHIGSREQEIPLGQWREEESIDFNEVERGSVA